MLHPARRSGAAAAAPLLGLALGLAVVLGGAPAAVDAAKRQPTVTATFEGPPESASLGAPVQLRLRLTASEEAPDTTADLLAPAGVRVLSGADRWTGAVLPGEGVLLRLTVAFTAPGASSLGVRVTTRNRGAIEVSGAVLNARASGAGVVLSPDALGLMRMRSAGDVSELRALGIAPESPPSTAAPSRGIAVPAPEVAGTTITGRVRWLDPEGRGHPVRRAYVEILEGTARAPVARTSTDDRGVYTATVMAGTVVVAVYSRDAEGRRLEVAAPGAPALRYVLESGVVPVAGEATVIDLTSAAPVRGAPGAPSVDSLPARAFAVYDAILTFWAQASALLGREVGAVRVSFPAPTTSGCGTTCYLPETREIFVLREDAFDWDVLGHEFFHFVAISESPRPIDTNPGGGHSGGSAIGQPPRPGALPRTRDEGMRLAWSEGLATFMSLALQRTPLDPAFDFPRDLLSVGDATYEDSEDVLVALEADAPTRREGFGSANSVLGFLWALFVGRGDEAPAVSARTMWRLLAGDLPCDPCDRVDRVWTALTRLLGPVDDWSFEVARVLAANGIAPAALSPAAGSILSAHMPPAFAWRPGGDPSPAHENDRFLLAFSRDGFRSHVAVVEVPGLGSVSYTPTPLEWAAVRGGSLGGAEYQWVVVGARHDAPALPEGWYWYSDVQRFVLAE